MPKTIEHVHWPDAPDLAGCGVVKKIRSRECHLPLLYLRVQDAIQRNASLGAQRLHALELRSHVRVSFFFTRDDRSAANGAGTILTRNLTRT